MNHRVCIALGWAWVVSAGCSSEAPPAAAIPSGAVPDKIQVLRLSEAEVDRFLEIVAAHPSRRVPEFVPGAPPDFNAKSAATDHVAQIRRAFRQGFDAERQGAVWTKDRDWSRVLKEHSTTGPEFAELVLAVSSAVMRDRLARRIEPSRLAAASRQQLQKLIDDIGRLDRQRKSARSVQDRTTALLRLSQASALHEFAMLLEQVPAENCDLVRRYAKQLQPLLPADLEQKIGQMELPAP